MKNLIFAVIMIFVFIGCGDGGNKKTRFMFPANDGEHGFELWKSDGTAEGTIMVKDIYPGRGSSYSYNFTTY